MTQLPESIWQTKGIVGRHLASDRLGDIVGTESTVMVFLRHLG